MKIFHATPFILSFFILAGCGGDDSENNSLKCESINELRSNMLYLVNQARSQERFCGNTFYAAARPLSWNNQLAQAAQAHSTDMATNNFFSHTGSNGTNSASRVENTGYLWVYHGENLAASVESSEKAIALLLDSPGHCQNIMDPNYLELGAACANNNDSQHALYWTQEFGTR